MQTIRFIELPIPSAVHCSDVTRTEIHQARLRVNLGGRNALVPQELLYLIQRHACVQQQGRHARPQAMRCDAASNSSDSNRYPDLRLPRCGQDRYEAVTAHLGVRELNLRRLETEAQIAHTDIDEFTDSSAGVEQGFDHQPVLT